MSKSTHQGTCQVCGRLQMLPKGVLAKHGYDVQFGFFNGTCWGAGYRPFEEATDAIDLAIKWAQNNKTALETEMAQLTAAPVTDEAPFHRYIAGTFQVKAHRAEVMVKIFEKDGHQWIQFPDEKVEPCMRYSLYGTKEEIVLKLRERRTTRYQEAIDAQAKYIAWQQARVTSWKPGKLVKVKATHKG